MTDQERQEFDEAIKEYREEVCNNKQKARQMLLPTRNNYKKGKRQKRKRGIG